MLVYQQTFLRTGKCSRFLPPQRRHHDGDHQQYMAQ
jgi:hypothetical protein